MFMFLKDTEDKKTYLRRDQCLQCHSWILNYEYDCYTSSSYSHCCNFEPINWPSTLLYFVYMIISFNVLVILALVLGFVFSVNFASFKKHFFFQIS